MESYICTTDNNLGRCLIGREQYENLAHIGNKALSELNESEHILIYPNALTKAHGDIGKQKVFEILKKGEDRYALSTGNLMGYIGVNDTQVRIRSRFAQSDDRDCFVHYLLSKAFHLNMFDLKYSLSNDAVFNLLYCLFVQQLKRAYRQGIFKVYTRRLYNDTRLRGCIDIARHIRENLPFCGNIAYTFRERSDQSPLMMLVRHAIEMIKAKPFGNYLLSGDKDIQSAVGMVMQATETYRSSDRMNVLRDNAQPVQHPYFTEYGVLQRISRMIVCGQKHRFGASQDQAYGVLFDGAWLWEQYLAGLLCDLGFEHPDNIAGKKPLRLFEDSSGFRRYPDFIHHQRGIILDAKYKVLDDKHGDGETNCAYDRNDLHQVITYMYITQVQRAGFVYPSHIETDKVHIGSLKGYGGEMFKIGLKIPQHVSDMTAFCKAMLLEEAAIKSFVF